MPGKWLLTIVAVCLFSAAFAGARAAAQSLGSVPPAPPAGAQPKGPGESGYVLKVTTRLVTLDLIATDSHGNPVRDLKPEDLQIFEEHKAPQKIEQFEFIEKPASAKPAENPPAAARQPANVYSNQLSLDQLKIPPTVLLMDSLNTQTANQMQGRAHMLQLLKTLPPDTPIAVFLLGSSLKVLQGFTSDGGLLRAAVDQAIGGAMTAKVARDDPNSSSNFMLNSTNGMAGAMALGAQSMVSDVQDFEKEQYANTFDLRARLTLEALTSIGQYLSGIPGRKNLIWVSESFPISIAPDPTTGNNPFEGIRDYSDRVITVANALTDAQVAVYPMDVRGLQAEQSFTASQSDLSGNMMTGPGLSNILNDEDTTRLQSQGTMDELAQDTGGKTCKNVNDLSACVMMALKDSSSYYELSFYPQHVNWDGRFHRIVVRTSRPGVKLVYRRGYYAFDAAALAKKKQPGDHLRQACSDQLPSTAIHLTVQAVPPGQFGNQRGGLQYMLSISAAGLGSSQAGDLHSISLALAACEFAQKTDSYRFYGSNLTKSVSDEVFRSWQSAGIPDHVALMPDGNTRRIRFVVLDVTSGLTGAIDIPVLPSEIAKATTPVPPPAPIVTTPFLELPDKDKSTAPPKLVGSVTFHLKSGEAGILNWSGDTLLFGGDIPEEQAAIGFFSYAFGDRYHCQDGHFVPVDPADSEPVMRFTFHNHDGKVLTVDLKGAQPFYLGDLPVDPRAKLLFDRVWKSSHCQAP